MTIQSTRDYTLFNKLAGNRDVNRAPLRKLKRAIEEDNQLHNHPILVNKDWVVIDGQHRLQAAKELGLPIYYIKDDYLQDKHLITCNANQETFKTDDYINYYTKTEKVEDYIELQKSMELTKLGPKAFLCLVLGGASSDILGLLKKGLFRFPKDKSYTAIISIYLNFIAYTEDKRMTPYGMFRSNTFTKAFRWLCHTSGFKYEMLMKKMDLKWFEVKPQSGAEQWYTLLINIYNFKNTDRLVEEFGKTADKDA